MPPLTLSCHVASSFIVVDHLCRSQSLLDLFFNAAEREGTAVNHGLDASSTDRAIKQMREDFRCPANRLQLLAAQIYGRCPTSAPYCTGAFTSAGKGATVMVWHRGQHLLWLSCSVTTVRLTGRLITCRLSSLMLGMLCKSLWQ